jgi:hypothetical protein
MTSGPPPGTPAQASVKPITDPGTGEVIGYAIGFPEGGEGGAHVDMLTRFLGEGA